MNEALTAFLKTRRSTPTKFLAEPGPDPETLNEILSMATRVPDHGKLNPWYFVVFDGDARHDFARHIRTAYTARNPDATQAQLDHEADKLLRAPVVVAVISRLRPSVIPAWEQYLSAGLVCHTLCMAAHSFGFASNWLSEWVATDPHIRKAMALENGRDHIVGFIYLGTQTEKPDERPRPETDRLINHWGHPITNKGDNYDREGLTIQMGDVTL